MIDEDLAGLLFNLAVTSLLMVLVGRIVLRHVRLLFGSGLPITREIASNRLGLVCLAGKARSLDDSELVAPMSGRPCVWFRTYTTGRTLGGEPALDLVHETDRSHFSFYVDDGVNRCLIDPDLGYVSSSRRIVREIKPRSLLNNRGPCFRIEERIKAGDTIYCTGHLKMELGPDRQQMIDAGVRTIMNRWKADRKAMVERFDQDADGEIDMAEWEAARREAEQKVAAELKDVPTLQEQFRLAKPEQKNMPFAVDTRPPRPAGMREYLRVFGWGFILLMLLGLAGLMVAVYWSSPG